jgi:hypothetical protein
VAKFRYVGSHAVEVYQGDNCVMVAPGDYIELSAEDEKRDENEGLELIPATEKKGGDK